MLKWFKKIFFIKNKIKNRNGFLGFLKKNLPYFKNKADLNSNISFLVAEWKYFVELEKIVPFLFLHSTIPNKRAVVVGINQIKI